MRRFKHVSPMRFMVMATSTVFLLALLLSFSTAQQPPPKESKKKKKSGGSSSSKSKGGKNEKKEKRKKSDVIAFWYKPHYQCNGSDGSTPERAARFINRQLDPPAAVASANASAAAAAVPAADFVGISEWVGGPQNLTIGNPDQYGVIGAVCGYGNTDYTTPMALFYRVEHWSLQASYPPLAHQCTVVPTLPWEGSKIGPVCVNKVQPTNDEEGNNTNCCSCTYSEQEYQRGVEWNLNLGQRPWVAGRFVSKKTRTNKKRQEVCVVAGEVPHPMQNTTLTNVNGKMIPWNDPNPKPYTTAIYQCTTTLPLTQCVPNLSNSSILFGTDTLMAGVTEFCGTDVPIILMADTNVGMGYVSTGSLFLQEPFQSLTSSVAVAAETTTKTTLNSYTCCNDTGYGGVLNAFASDRIAVTSQDLMIDHLEGGSVAPTGPVPRGMQYQCAAAEEHLPLRAYISFQ
mmetsp:Transcript_21723/g.23292  ORF Transcript_21723/g.23292 Transcript_21723/m.23292 type:complete len:456 (+) Transcript_21723:58-1425(+)